MKIRLAIIAAAVFALQGCGGGEDDIGLTAAVPKTALELQDDRIDKAMASGAQKVAYALSSDLGKFGNALKNDGWSFITTDIGKAPNQSETVLYINTEVFQNLDDAHRDAISRFSGVVVIDSNFTARPKVDFESGMAVDLTEQVTENHPVANLVTWLSQDTSKAQQISTAIITSAKRNTITAIDMDSDGKINGHDMETGMKMFSPLVDVALLQEEAERPIPKSGNPPGGWDRHLEFVSWQAGWHLVGQVQVEAWREGSGSSPRHFVEVQVWTGNNHEKCYARGIECGVYPSNKDEIITNRDNHGSGPWITVWGPAYEYKAFARANPALQITGYSPPASQWTKREAWENDSYEKVWSEGFSIGGSAGVSTAGSWSSTFSASYSRSVVKRKVTHLWDAWDDIDTGYGSKAREAWVVIRNKRGNDLPEFINTWEEFLPTYQRQDGYGNKGRENFRLNYLRGHNGNNMRNWKVANRDIKIDGPGQPRMSYEGWNPHINVSFEIDKNRILRNNGSSFVDVTAGVGLVRQRTVWSREHARSNDDEKRYIGYRLRENNVNNVHFGASATVRVPASSFRN